MKRGYLFIFFLFIAPGLSAQTTDTLSYISLKPAYFMEELVTVSDPLIIDVREFFEYKKARIRRAVNIPSSGSIDVPVDTIDKVRHIFLYCTSGFRSKRVAQKFAEHGFIHIYNLDGGITGWKKEGNPVDRRRLRKKG